MSDPRVVAQQWISLDGFAAGSGGEGDVMRALTAEGVARGEDHAVDLLRSVDRVLLGRRTYEQFLEFWPTARGRMPDLVNRVPKTLASRTLDAAPWGEHAPADLARDAVELARRHRVEGSGVLLVWGSIALMNDLVAAGQLDELDLVVAPVALGSGRPLLERPARLRQLASEDWGGVTHLRCALD